MAPSRYESLKSKFGYATGDILGGGAFALLSLLFLDFLVNVEGISSSLAGAIVLAGKVWDAVSDPLMGVISDRTTSRYGRRRVYILAGVLPVILTFGMLWYSFGIQTQTGKFLYYLLAYILFSSAFTLVMVPYNALLPDMVSDYKARTGFSTIRMFVSNLAALISVTLPGVLLGEKTAGNYRLMGLVFGLFFGLPLVVTYLTTWELPDASQKACGSFGEMLGQLRESFRNRAYRQYLGIFVCGQMATDMCTTLMAFWLADVVQKSGLLSLMTGLTMVVAVLLLPFNNHIAKTKGKQVPAVLEQPFRMLGMAMAFFAGKEAGLPFLILICLLSGIGASASSFVPWTLLPDLPDSDEMISGRRNAGIYAGASTFVRKFTSGFAIFLIGVALEGFGYIESTAGQTVVQPPLALLGVRILFALVPILLSGITWFLAKQYTLTMENHGLIRKAIQAKRETGTPIADPAVIRACEEVAGRKFNTMWVGMK